MKLYRLWYFIAGFSYGVALLGGDLEAGHAFLGKLSNNVPTHLCGELMASLLLHGDVILFDLLQRGNAIQAANSFTSPRSWGSCRGS